MNTSLIQEKNELKKQYSNGFIAWTGLLCQDVRTFCKTCKKCQLSKKARSKYGHLQTKEAESDPWTQVHIDLVGPWPVQTQSEKKYLTALTCIDPATGWFEMIEITRQDCRVCHGSVQ
jgi:hypothetical protein